MNFKTAATPVTKGCMAITMGLFVRVIRKGKDRWLVRRRGCVYWLKESEIMCIDGYDETQDRKFNHQG